MARIPSEECGDLRQLVLSRFRGRDVCCLRGAAGAQDGLAAEERYWCFRCVEARGALDMYRGAARFLLQGIAVRAPTRTGTVEVPGPYGRGIDGFRETAGAGRWSRGSSRIRFLRGDGGREQPFLHYTCKNRSSITRSSDSTPSFTSLKVLENSH